jgi:hypothetical protein
MQNIKSTEITTNNVIWNTNHCLKCLKFHYLCLLYFSPSNVPLKSPMDIAKYLTTDGSCKCGLECPCNQCLSPLKLWVWIVLMVRCTRYNIIKFVSDLWQVGGFLRFPSPKKTDCHDITEILLKVALNTITLTLIYTNIFP